jgi:hypothetical protein
MDWQSPTGFRVHSHADDDWRACHDHVARLLGVEQWRADIHKGPAVSSATPKLQRCDDGYRSELALSIFREARLLAGTMGETYLRNRLGAAAP